MLHSILHNCLDIVRYGCDIFINRVLLSSSGGITVNSYGTTIIEESDHLGFFEWTIRK